MKFNFSPYAPTKHDTETLEIQLWDKLANSGLLVAPGWFFAADQVPGASPDSASEGHFRISFSTTEVSFPPQFVWKVIVANMVLV